MPELDPAYRIPPNTPDGPVDLLVVVPYIEGMLREQSLAALDASGLAYLTQPLDPTDPYDYAARFREWWNLPMDLIVMEQDIVPTPAQFAELAAHPAPWVAMPYHVGNGQLAMGLGFCKLAHRLRTAHPTAGVNISVDPRDGRNLVDWISLNESVERHLTRLGETQIIVQNLIEHLHYPVPAHG